MTEAATGGTRVRMIPATVRRYAAARPLTERLRVAACLLYTSKVSTSLYNTEKVYRSNTAPTTLYTNMLWLDTVSYTHLDVYKRQV